MTIGRIPSVEGGIQPTIVDAKGDLIAGVAADSINRLAVGSNDQVLVADSSTSTGLAWKSYGLQTQNPVLNSSFQVWQRGTSGAGAVSSSTGFVADRWQAGRAAFAAGMTVSRQVTGDTTNLPFIQYCARVQRDSGNTGTGAMFFTQNFESVNSIPFAGKTITLSFYARVGANYSSASNALSAFVYTGTGTDQNLFTTGYTGSATAVSGTATLTTTWQRFSFSGSVSATATEMAVQLFYTPTGTAGANDYFEVTGVQVEVGSVATPFRTYAATLQGELAACQRYYYRNTGSGAFSTFGQGAAPSTTSAAIQIPLLVTMRTTPTVVDFANLRLDDGVNAYAVTSATTSTTTSSTSLITATCNVASGLTQYRTYNLSCNNNSAGYVGFSAEL